MIMKPAKAKVRMNRVFGAWGISLIAVAALSCGWTLALVDNAPMVAGWQRADDFVTDDTGAFSDEIEGLRRALDQRNLDLYKARVELELARQAAKDEDEARESLARQHTLDLSDSVPRIVTAEGSDFAVSKQLREWLGRR